MSGKNRGYTNRPSSLPAAPPLNEAERRAYKERLEARACGPPLDDYTCLLDPLSVNVPPLPCPSDPDLAGDSPMALPPLAQSVVNGTHAGVTHDGVSYPSIQDADVYFAPADTPPDDAGRWHRLSDVDAAVACDVNAAVAYTGHYPAGSYPRQPLTALDIMEAFDVDATLLAPSARPSADDDPLDRINAVLEEAERWEQDWETFAGEYSAEAAARAVADDRPCSVPCEQELDRFRFYTDVCGMDGWAAQAYNQPRQATLQLPVDLVECEPSHEYPSDVVFYQVTFEHNGMITQVTRIGVDLATAIRDGQSIVSGATRIAPGQVTISDR